VEDLMKVRRDSLLMGAIVSALIKNSISLFHVCKYLEGPNGRSQAIAHRHQLKLTRRSSSTSLELG
ncbi:MAG: hypothetical protein VYC82_09545, partial [Verrucomicrobiota bacterium]|nr:hypothetical protein [Verrucomicrobiota bacterium]